MDTVLPNEAISREPFPGLRKVYAQGSDPSIRVPFRAIALTNGEVHTVYDTSGPFTDPDVAIDVRAGIAPLRRALDRRPQRHRRVGEAVVGLPHRAASR